MKITEICKLEEHFMDLRRIDALPDDLSMNCLCLVASGMQNARETLGWDESQEWNELAIRSVECLLSDESDEVISEFRKVGITY